MRRIGFFALLGVLISGYISLAYAAGPMIELEYTFPEPTLEMVDGEYHSVDMPDTGKFYDASGLPLLPVKTAKILMPQGRDVKAINVVPGKRIFLDGEFRIEYGTPAIPMGSNPAFEAMPDQRVYNSDKPFPGNLYSFVSTQFLCGYKILILNLYPVQYNPASGKIWYHENLKVIVAHAPEGPPGLQRAKCRGLRQDRARVRKIVDNPSQAISYSAEVTALQGEIWTYLIITSEAMAPTFQTELAGWKSSRFPGATHVETVENIKRNYSGRDLQEQIRNFIIDAHDIHKTEYVLLGGDGDAGKGKSKPIIPCRGVYGEVVNTLTGQTWIDENIPCDMYYGALDGDWDYNGNGIFGEYGDGIDGGEIDLEAEVFVGRIAADDLTEALNQINKIKAYEISAPSPSVLLVGRNLSEDPVPDGTWGGDYKDEVYDYYFLPAGWSEKKLYENGLSSEAYSQDALIREMNEGGHHVVNYMSHSGYYNDMGLSNDQIVGLENTIYFLAYSQGCNAGGFDQRFDDCAGEHFTVEDGIGGAFAYIGNTRYGWYRKGTTNGPSQQFDKQMFHAFFNEGILNIGAALQDSKEDLIGFIGPTGAMRWCYFELCLLGDPETPFGATPLPADIEAPDAVTNLVALNPTSSSIELTWTAPNDDSGCPAMQYDIRYSSDASGGDPGSWWDQATQCEQEPIPKPAGQFETYTVTGLSSGQLYYFALKSTDGVPNESGISNIATGSTSAGGDKMHVEGITPEPVPERLDRGKNVFWKVSATVLVHDQNGNAVENATVYGDWSGVYSATNVSATTNADGKAVFTTDYVKDGGAFRFDITSLVHDSLEHDSGADVKTYIEITAPPSASAPVAEYTTSLENAYPSMANPEVWIPFTLAAPEHVAIRIFDMSGRLVRKLDLGQMAPGVYRSKEKAAYWDGKSEAGEQVSSGIYFYTIQAGEFTATKKMAIAR